MELAVAELGQLRPVAGGNRDGRVAGRCGMAVLLRLFAAPGGDRLSRGEEAKARQQQEAQIRPGRAERESAHRYLHTEQTIHRSEERRVGKECRSRWSP